MTPSDQPDRRPTGDGDEVDPTGVRALLQGLSDPGPMPADLVRRIEARLEVEQEHRRSALSQGATRGRGHSDDVIDLAAERSRRRPGRTLALLGAAAAGLVVTTVALNQVGIPGGTDAGTAAYAPSAGDQQPAASTDAASDDAAQGDSAAEGEFDEAREESAAGGADDGAALTAAADSGAALPASSALLDVVVLPPVGAVDDDIAARMLAAHASNEAAADPEITVAQAKSCWSIPATEGSWSSYYASTGSLDGFTVVVLLGQDGPREGRVWVLPSACTEDSTVRPVAQHPVGR